MLADDDYGVEVVQQMAGDFFHSKAHSDKTPSDTFTCVVPHFDDPTAVDSASSKLLPCLLVDIIQINILVKLGDEL